MKIMRILTFILAALILIGAIPLTAFASASSVQLEEWQSNGLVDVSGNLLPNGIKGIKKVSSDKAFPDDPNRYTVEIQVESKAPAEAKNGKLLFIIARKNEEALNDYKAILNGILPEILTEGSGNQVSIIALGDTVEVLWEKGNYFDLQSILTALNQLTPSKGIYLDKALRMVREDLLTQNGDLETFLMIDDVVGYSTKVTKTASSVYCGDNCSSQQWMVVPTEYSEGQIVGIGTTDKNGIHFERVAVPNATCNRQRLHSYLTSSGKYPTVHSDVAVSEANMLLDKGGILHIYSRETVSEQIAVYSTMESTGYYNNRVKFESLLLEKYVGNSGAGEKLLLKDTLSTFAIIDERTISASSSKELPVVETVDGEIFCSFSGDLVLKYSFIWNVFDPNFLRETEYSIGAAAQHPTTVNYIDELGEERFVSLNQPKARGFYGKVYANGYLANFILEPLGINGEVVANKTDAKILLESGVDVRNPDAYGENRWLPNSKVLVSPSLIEVEGHLLSENPKDEIELTLEGSKDATIYFPLYREYETLTIKYEFQADLNSAPPMQEVKVDNIKAGIMLHKEDIVKLTKTAVNEGTLVIPPEYELTENSIVFPTTQVLSSLETRVFLTKRSSEPSPGTDPIYSFTLGSYKRVKNNELELFDERQSGELQRTSDQFIISGSSENLQEGYIFVTEEYIESIGNSQTSYTLDKIFVNGIEKDLGRWFSLDEGNAGNQIRVEYKIKEMTAKEVEVLYKLIGTAETQTQTLYNVPVDATGEGVEGQDFSADPALWEFFSTNYEFVSVKLFEEGREPREVSFNLDQKLFENLSLENDNARIEISFFAPYHFSYVLYFDGVPYLDVCNVEYYGEEITFDKLISKQDRNWEEHYGVIESLSPNLPIPSYEVEDYYTPEKAYLEIYLEATAGLPYEVQFYERLESGEYVSSKTLWYDAPIPPTIKIDDQSLAIAGFEGKVEKIAFFSVDEILIGERNDEALFATITFNQNLFKIYYTPQLDVKPPDPEDPKDPENPGGELPSEGDLVEVETRILFEGEEFEAVQAYLIDAPVFLWQTNKKLNHNYHEYELNKVEVFKTPHNNYGNGVLSLGFSDAAAVDAYAADAFDAEIDVVGDGEAYVFFENYDYTMKLYYKKISFVGVIDEGDNSGNNNFAVVESKKNSDSGSYKGETLDKAVLSVATKKDVVEKGTNDGNLDTSPINSTYKGTYPSVTLPRAGRPAEPRDMKVVYKWQFLYNLVLAEVVLIIPKRKSFLSGMG